MAGKIQHKQQLAIKPMVTCLDVCSAAAGAHICQKLGLSPNIHRSLDYDYGLWWCWWFSCWWWCDCDEEAGKEMWRLFPVQHIHFVKFSEKESESELYYTIRSICRMWLDSETFFYLRGAWKTQIASHDFVSKKSPAWDGLLLVSCDIKISSLDSISSHRFT